jgi:RND family efflux transporter MFP subunit
MFWKKKSFYKENKKTLVTISIILLLLVLGYNAVGGKKDVDNAQKGMQSVSLLSLSEYKENQAFVKGTGEVKAMEQVELKSEVSATVNEVLVSIGDEVEPGQALVRFENGGLSSQYQQSKADLDRALATKDQVESQYQMALANYTKIESSINSSIVAAQAAYDLAENNLKLNNAESTSEILKNAYKDVVPKIKTLHTTLRSSLLEADSILGITVKSANDTFENKISLNDVSALYTAESQYNRAYVKVNDVYNLVTNLTTESSNSDIDESLEKLETAYDSIEILWNNLDVVLNNTTGLDLFDDLKVIVDGGKTDMTSLSSGILNIRQILDSAKTSLNGVEIAYNKAEEDLKETKKRAEADLQSAKSQLDQAEIALRLQDTAIARSQAVLYGVGSSLSKTTIKSPIKGKVAVIPAREGQLMTPGSLVALVVNTNGMIVRAYVNSDDASRVSVGSDVKISGFVKGIVTNVAPSIDPTTRKVEVLVAVSNPEESKLVVGQYVSIEIEDATDTTGDNVIRLPLKSIDVTDSGAFVYVLGEDNVVEKREVTLNRVIGTDVEVISGLDNIDEIIKSVRGIDVGEKVEIK